MCPEAKQTLLQAMNGLGAVASSHSEIAVHKPSAWLPGSSGFKPFTWNLEAWSQFDAT